MKYYNFPYNQFNSLIGAKSKKKAINLYYRDILEQKLPKTAINPHRLSVAYAFIIYTTGFIATLRGKQLDSKSIPLDISKSFQNGGILLTNYGVNYKNEAK